jgi:2-aminoethylphosphonate-pyruvate transaminase
MAVLVCVRNDVPRLIFGNGTLMRKLAYDLAVFDLAGTTVEDGGDVVAGCVVDAIEAVVAFRPSLPQVNAVMGIEKQAAITHILQHAGLSAEAGVVRTIYERFVASMIAYYREDPSVREVAGASETFAALRERGVRIGLDSGFARIIGSVVVERMGWASRGLIDAVVFSDEVPQGRPAPFMIHKMMEQLGVIDVRRVVKVGDTPSDLYEATNAGCGRVVGVLAGSHTLAQLRSHPHTDLIPDVTHLVDCLDECLPRSVRLFTPGPANTSPRVRRAMDRDIGAWDDDLVDACADVRRRVLRVADVPLGSDFECVLLQGSGTYGVEATLSAAVKPGGSLLIAANGAYGLRMSTIAQALGIRSILLTSSEREPIDTIAIGTALAQHPEVTAVAVVHCETTSGVMNDIATIGQLVRKAGRPIEFVVDAMSSFGAVSIDLEQCGIDWLVASSNKCLQGVPGLAIVLARRESLKQSASHKRGLSLDLHDQWRGFESHGRFRFTPPTHVLLALQQALVEHEFEGGVEARGHRYARLQQRLAHGMAARGFETYVEPAHQSCVITTFLHPSDVGFDFPKFYQALSRRGLVIYPGKLTAVDCFRLGHLGELKLSDIDDLLQGVDEALAELGVELKPSALEAESTQSEPIGA